METTAVVDYFADPPAAKQRLTAWAREQSRVLSTGIRVWVPQKNMSTADEWRGMAHSLEAPLVSPRSPAYSGDRRVVVAVWPTGLELAGKVPWGPCDALGVLSHSDLDTRVWRRVTGARDLDDRPAGFNRLPWEFDDVVAAALKAVAIVVRGYAGLASPDRERAASALVLLHRDGHSLPEDQLLGWALDQGWSAGTAENFAKLARQVASGGGVRVGSPPMFTAEHLASWHDEASTGSTQR